MIWLPIRVLLAAALTLFCTLVVQAQSLPKNGSSPRAGTDAHGDLLPPRAMARLGTVRLRHGRSMSGVAFTPDGKALVTASQDHSIVFWEPTDGKKLRQLDGHRDQVRCLTFTRDGKFLATGGNDHTICIWEMATGKRVQHLAGTFGPVLAVAFNPEGTVLAAGCEDGTLRLWDVTTGENRQILLGHPGPVSSVAFSMAGKVLASAGGDSVVRLWDPTTGRETQQLRGHTGSVVAVAFSGDGKTLASGGQDMLIRLWDVATSKETRVLRGHTAEVSVLAFTPDGRTLASGSTDKTLRLWDLQGGGGPRSLGTHYFPLLCLAFAPDGKTLASGTNQDGTVRLWDVASGAERAIGSGHTSWARAVVYSADGKTVVTGGVAGKVIFWDRHGLRERARGDHGGTLGALVRSADGKVLLSSGSGPARLRLWDVATGKSGRDLGQRYDVAAWFLPAAVTDDGKTAAVAAAGTITLHEVATGQEQRRFFGGGTINTLDFAPGGKTLAAGGSDLTVQLWDLTRGVQTVRRLTGHKKVGTGSIVSVVFAPDGNSLASWAGDRTLRLWETATGKTRRVFYIGPATGLIGYGPAIFSPDGRFLAAAHADHSVRRWEVLTGRELPPLVGHNGWIRALAYSPDGKELASASDDTTVLLWDTSDQATPTPAGANLTPKDLNEHWTDLASADAIQAYRAQAALVRAPQQSVPFLKSRLLRASTVSTQQLIADLDSERFWAREKAHLELEKLGWLAEGPLRAVLSQPPSTEAASRANHLLKKLRGSGPAPDSLRAGRAIEVLELVGDTAARALLQALARPDGGQPEAETARAALQRLTRSRR